MLQLVERLTTEAVAANIRNQERMTVIEKADPTLYGLARSLVRDLLRLEYWE